MSGGQPIRQYCRVVDQHEPAAGSFPGPSPGRRRRSPPRSATFSKTVVALSVHRGFEFLPLRLTGRASGLPIVLDARLAQQPGEERTRFAQAALVLGGERIALTAPRVVAGPVSLQPALGHAT